MGLNTNQVEVSDEGVLQGLARLLDFVGAGVTATMVGDIATITIPGGSAGADPSYSPGSFTIATETARLFMNHLKLTTTQRATLVGTARLKLSN